MPQSRRLKQFLVSLPDPAETVERIARFLKSYFENSGSRGAVIGLSGGVDSSVTASLCALALKPEKVLGLSMPDGETDPRSVRDARLVAEDLRIRLRQIEISPVISSFVSTVPSRTRSRIVQGNLKARARAMLLFYYANLENRLVVGTGDKSEIMIGYFTKFGDGASDLLPIGDLYKTSVRQLARHLGLRERIAAKPSTPGLWPTQSARKELGESYEVIDLILWALEHWWTPQEIAAELAVSLRLVNSVYARWISSEHKRRMPLIPKIGFRTVGLDFRLPYNA